MKKYIKILPIIVIIIFIFIPHKSNAANNACVCIGGKTFEVDNNANVNSYNECLKWGKTLKYTNLTCVFELENSTKKPSIKPLIGKGGYVECVTDPNKVLNLDCFLALLGGVSKLILGLTGSLALLYFIYGGIVLLTSGGVENRITQGKTILSHALIGVIIIFGAYVLVVFVEKSLGVNLGSNSGLNKSIDPNNIKAPEINTNTSQSNTGQIKEYYCYRTKNIQTSGPKPKIKTEEILVGNGFSNQKDCMDYCITQVVNPQCVPKIKN